MTNRLLVFLWASTLALTLSVVSLTAHDVTLAQVYNGGGLDAGVGAAAGITGPIKTPLDVTVVSVINTVLTYVALAAVIAIIVAGLYMILSGGSQADKAKTIIIWTLVGLAVILLAKVIVILVYTWLGGTPGSIGINVPNGNDPRQVIVNILQMVLNFVGLAAVIAIVIAGIYLIVGMGSDESKERAKKIIIYTIVGLVVILLAKLLVSLPGILIH